MIRRLSVLLATALLLTGCSTTTAATVTPTTSAQPALSSIQPVSSPTTITGPATAVLADRTITPVATTEQQQLPATVESHLRSGSRQVSVTDTSRIIALDLSGSIAATVWALGLGDRLVARDVSSDFPGVENLPVVTSDGHSVNAEAVLAQRPTFVLTDGSLGPRDVIEQLADTGVTVVFLTNESSLTGAAQLARDVAAAVGLPKTGKTLATQITNQVKDVVAQVAGIAPKNSADKLRIVFLYVRASSDVYYLLGDDSGVGDLIKALGGVDVAAQAGWKQARPLTDEAVVAAKPDLFLMMTHGLDSAGGVDALLASKPALALTPAGERRRIVDMADADVLSFGPRTAAVIDALARAIYTKAKA